MMFEIRFGNKGMVMTFGKKHRIHYGRWRFGLQKVKYDPISNEICESKVLVAL